MFKIYFAAGAIYRARYRHFTFHFNWKSSVRRMSLDEAPTMML